MLSDVTEGVTRVKSGHKVSLNDAELAIVPEGFHNAGVFPDWLFREIPSSDKDRRREVAKFQLDGLSQAPHNNERMKAFQSQYSGNQVTSTVMVGEGRLSLVDNEDRKTPVKVWLFDQHLAWSGTEGSIDVVLPLSSIVVRMTNKDPHQWFLTYIDRSKPPVKIACMTKNEAKDWLNYIWLCQIALGLDGTKTGDVAAGTSTSSTPSSGMSSSSGADKSSKQPSGTGSTTTPSGATASSKTGSQVAPDPKQLQLQQMQQQQLRMAQQQQQMKMMQMKQMQMKQMQMQAMQQKGAPLMTKSSAPAPPPAPAGAAAAVPPPAKQ